MSRYELSEYERTEYDEFLKFVGQYVLMFQSIEGILDACLLLLWGHENWADSQRRLATLRNQEKVDALSREFQTNPKNARGQQRPEWVADFTQLMIDAHQIRQDRNSLLHSQYIYDFMRIGALILKSDRKRGEIRFDRTDVTKAWPDEQITRLVQVGWRLGQAKIQLISDYEVDERMRHGRNKD